MGYIPDVNVVDEMSDNDNFIIQVGQKTRQISKANALDGVIGSTFANVIDSTASDYTLVPQSVYPVTQIMMNADNGDNGEVVIPQGSFELGATYVVTNQSVSTEDLAITLSSGVTLNNGEASFIDAKGTDEGNGFGVFVNVGTNSWIVYGDIVTTE